VKAIRCNRYGPPEGLTLEEVPDPVPAPGQAVVEVHAASVNFPDVLMIQDKYQVSLPPPFTPGSEFAGIVTAVGDGVRNVAPGDHVFGATFVGGFAEQTIAAAASLTRVPDGVDLHEAAAFGVVYTTAYHSLRSVADVKPGEWVVVLGAAGGVGLASVDVALQLGARVVAAASSAERLELCRERGAEGLIDYSTEDLKVRIREITGEGADVVIDPVGGPWAEQALRSTRWGGRFVTVGYASGEIPRIPLNLVLLKGMTIVGFEMRTFAEHAPDSARRDREELMALFGAGKLHPHVSAVYSLADTPAALRAVADRRVTGKVVIDPTR
jgi:NADPH:quinone reductase